MPAIPMHQLLDRSKIGLQINYFQAGDHKDEADTMAAHRDDHYIFFLVESGTAGLMIDFQRIEFDPRSLYFVLPGQVHYRISNEMAYGWFLAVDTGLLTTEQRQVFEQRLNLQELMHLDEDSHQRYQNVLMPLLKHYQSDSSAPFYLQILYALLQAFIGMVASEYKSAEKKEGQHSRKMELSQLFKQQLSKAYKTMKSPSAYAEFLHVTPAYLNEALKQITGMPVSYWIINEVMLEAKRMLYYTQLSVKEVAQELGYNDPNYFFRLFRQHNGITPMAFRAQYHE